MVVFLLKQLDDLSFFGKSFAQKIADDVLWIIEEKDKEAFRVLDKELKKRIKKTKEETKEKI